MTIINNLYFAGMAELSEEELQKTWPGDKYADYRKRYQEETRGAFYRQFLQFLKDAYLDEYFLFIVTKDQLPGFRRHLDKYKLNDYIFWKEDEKLAVNRNHNEAGPRLAQFIFKFPKDYVPFNPYAETDK